MTDDLRDTDPAPPPPVILVVEDDPDFQQQLAEALRREGYAVVVASSGEAAVQALTTSPLPDLIALDLGLPRMSGREFLAVKAAYLRWRRIPVVVISERLAASDPIEASAVVPKPPDWEALLDLIQQQCPIVGRGGAG